MMIESSQYKSMRSPPLFWGHRNALSAPRYHNRPPFKALAIYGEHPKPSVLICASTNESKSNSEPGEVSENIQKIIEQLIEEKSNKLKEQQNTQNGILSVLGTAVSISAL